MSVRPLAQAARAVVVCDNDLCTVQISAKIAHVALALLGMGLALLVTHAPKRMLLRGWLLKAASPKN